MVGFGKKSKEETEVTSEDNCTGSYINSIISSSLQSKMFQVIFWVQKKIWKNNFKVILLKTVI